MDYVHVCCHVASLAPERENLTVVNTNAKLNDKNTRFTTCRTKLYPLAKFCDPRCNSHCAKYIKSTVVQRLWCIHVLDRIGHCDQQAVSWWTEWMTTNKDLYRSEEKRKIACILENDLPANKLPFKKNNIATLCVCSGEELGIFLGKLWYLAQTSTISMRCYEAKKKRKGNTICIINRCTVI